MTESGRQPDAEDPLRSVRIGKRDSLEALGIDPERLETIALAYPDRAQRVLRGWRLAVAVGHRLAPRFRRMADWVG